MSLSPNQGDHDDPRWISSCFDLRQIQASLSQAYGKAVPNFSEALQAQIRSTNNSMACQIDDVSNRIMSMQLDVDGWVTDKQVIQSVAQECKMFVESIERLVSFASFMQNTVQDCVDMFDDRFGVSFVEAIGIQVVEQACSVNQSDIQQWMLEPAKKMLKMVKVDEEDVASAKRALKHVSYWLAELKVGAQLAKSRVTSAGARTDVQMNTCEMDFQGEERNFDHNPYTPLDPPPCVPMPAKVHFASEEEHGNYIMDNDTGSESGDSDNGRLSSGARTRSDWGMPKRRRGTSTCSRRTRRDASVDTDLHTEDSPSNSRGNSLSRFAEGTPQHSELAERLFKLHEQSADGGDVLQEYRPRNRNFEEWQAETPPLPCGDSPYMRRSQFVEKGPYVDPPAQPPRPVLQPSLRGKVGQGFDRDDAWTGPLPPMHPPVIPQENSQLQQNHSQVHGQLPSQQHSQQHNQQHNHQHSHQHHHHQHGFSQNHQQPQHFQPNQQGQPNIPPSPSRQQQNFQNNQQGQQNFPQQHPGLFHVPRNQMPRSPPPDLSSPTLKFDNNRDAGGVSPGSTMTPTSNQGYVNSPNNDVMVDSSFKWMQPNNLAPAYRQGSIHQGRIQGREDFSSPPQFEPRQPSDRSRGGGIPPPPYNADHSGNGRGSIPMLGASQQVPHPPMYHADHLPPPDHYADQTLRDNKSFSGKEGGGRNCDAISDYDDRMHHGVSNNMNNIRNTFSLGGFSSKRNISDPQKPLGGEGRWWTNLMETCPISGFPVGLLPYPPFKLQTPVAKSKSRLVDGNYLVLLMLSSWRFEVLGVPVTASQIQALDAYMRRCKLGPFRLAHALEMHRIGTPSALEDLQALRDRATARLDVLQHVQRARLQRGDKEEQKLLLQERRRSGRGVGFSIQPPLQPQRPSFQVR